MSANRTKGPRGGKAAADGRGLTQAQSLKRQQLIVRLHDVEHLTFAEIATEVGMGEREVRAAFHRYVRDIAPLLNTLSAHDTVAVRLRVLEEAMQALRRLAQSADNDSAKVGALRELVKTIQTDIELRQHVGLIPRSSEGLALEHQFAWMAEQVVRLLERLGAGPEDLAELERVFAGSKEVGPE